MTDKTVRARVFVSCGQQKGTNEVKIAEEVCSKLENLGYDPYIAVAEQTLEGLKENVFKRLGESEYFLFIDFKRERLNFFGPRRGSLFSHQELAIAAYLGREVLAFQEEGLKTDDGLLRFIQANCIPFVDRHSLPNLIGTKVSTLWRPDWRNELLIERRDEDFVDVDEVNDSWDPARFYHIRVRNPHKDRTARNCSAILEKITDVLTGEEYLFEIVELKWKGVSLPQVFIPPLHTRYLDAFHILRSSEEVIHLPLNPFIIDYSGYAATLRPSGPVDLTYAVFSEGFPSAKATFRLQLGSGIKDTTFDRLSTG